MSADRNITVIPGMYTIPAIYSVGFTKHDIN